MEPTLYLPVGVIVETARVVSDKVGNPCVLFGMPQNQVFCLPVSLVIPRQYKGRPVNWIFFSGDGYKNDYSDPVIGIVTSAARILTEGTLYNLTDQILGIITLQPNSGLPMDMLFEQMAITPTIPAVLIFRGGLEVGFIRAEPESDRFHVDGIFIGKDGLKQHFFRILDLQETEDISVIKVIIPDPTN